MPNLEKHSQTEDGMKTRMFGHLTLTLNGPPR